MKQSLQISVITIINLLQVNHFLVKKSMNSLTLPLKIEVKEATMPEITFIGINSAEIKDHKKIDSILK